MWADIRRRDINGDLARRFGSTYVSDGWEATNRVPLINAAFITAANGGVYWRSVDTSGKIKDAEYTASLMIEDIYDFGCTNVILVVTDTCNTMKKCWEIVELEFPWISVLPCQPHVASLLLKDIGRIPEVEQLIKEEGIVVGWFANHQKPLAILRTKVKAKFGRAKELIKAAATRFGTNTLVGQRLLDLMQPLQSTVVDDEYIKMNYKDGQDQEKWRRATPLGWCVRTKAPRPRTLCSTPTRTPASGLDVPSTSG